MTPLSSRPVRSKNEVTVLKKLLIKIECQLSEGAFEPEPADLVRLPVPRLHPDHVGVVECDLPFKVRTSENVLFDPK